MAADVDEILDLNVRGTKQRLCRLIAGLFPGHYQVTIKRRFRGRTLAQNAYYWGVVLPVVCEVLEDLWGESVDVETAHDLMRDEFLTVTKVTLIEGRVRTYRLRRSTTKLETVEMIEYTDKIARWCLEEGGRRVPLPGEAEYEEEEAA